MANMPTHSPPEEWEIVIDTPKESVVEGEDEHKQSEALEINLQFVKTPLR